MRYLPMIGFAVLTAFLCTSTLAFADAEYPSSQAIHTPKDPVAAAERKSAHKADRLLAKNVRKALTQSNDVDLARMTVLAKSGKVTLSGSVPEEDQIQLAEQHAKAVAGVTTVANRLVIATPGH